jgi:DNA-binding response OmpR family regulator
MSKPKILLADDDMDILLLLRQAFQLEGFETVFAVNGAEVLKKAKEPGLSMVILDIVMPDVSGLNVCTQIRDELSIPILFLSAKDREIDKIIGLELGADDYNTKPFSVDELVARVKSHLRREARKEKDLRQSSLLQSGSITINKDTYEVTVNHEPVELSTKEFQILVYMAEHRNRVLSREQIYHAIWGDDFGDLNTVTVHLKNIRIKMDPDRRFIKTMWGAGYKFVG